MTSKNGVGTIVTEANFDLLKDVYAMRLKIAELIGTMGVVVLPSSLVDDLQALLEQALKVQVGEVLVLARINHQLHGLVCQIIENTALRQLYDLYYYQTSRVWYQKMPQFWALEVVALVDELTELIGAAKRQDVIALGYIKRNYIARVIGLLER